MVAITRYTLEVNLGTKTVNTSNEHVIKKAENLLGMLGCEESEPSNHWLDRLFPHTSE